MRLKFPDTAFSSTGRKTQRGRKQAFSSRFVLPPTPPSFLPRAISIFILATSPVRPCFLPAGPPEAVIPAPVENGTRKTFPSGSLARRTRGFLGTDSKLSCFLLSVRRRLLSPLKDEPNADGDSSLEIKAYKRSKEAGEGPAGGRGEHQRSERPA